MQTVHEKGQMLNVTLGGWPHPALSRLFFQLVLPKGFNASGLRASLFFMSTDFL